ncbi:M48 family metalloprotease [Embleya scabrispora]|uniref:M48 family metalloprotease n=1 Tax=Embleya scabrispora TaxID=159449 RepID=UPI0003AB0705|nr:M48 family metalloprotease [Embleya scabrispora]MYS86059.1 M48 family metalloprotease [Streptomyces sp. SID5474]
MYTSAPPWMLFWLVNACVFAVTDNFTVWRTALLDLLAVRSPPSSGGSGATVIRLVEVVDLVPPLLLIAAGASLLGAPLRRRVVERRYRLGAAERPGAVVEMVAFVHTVAPAVQVRANTRRLNVRAFVYPRGVVGSRLAICGGLVPLWRRDRAAAEAVLRHELSHCNEGDALTLGAVSPFEGVLRRWITIVVVFAVVPVSVAWVAQATDFLRAVGVEGARHTASQFWTLVLPDLMFLVLAATAQVLAAVTLPIAASWSAELVADHCAVRAADASAVRRALSGPSAGSPSGWLRGRITHPPNALRQALVAGGSTRRLLVATLVFPASWLLQLGWKLVAAAAVYGQLRMDVGEILRAERHNIAIWAQANRSTWLAAAALILAWPLIAPLWRRVLAGRAPVA